MNKYDSLMNKQLLCYYYLNIIFIQTFLIIDINYLIVVKAMLELLNIFVLQY